MIENLKHFMDVSSEVADALAERNPVVALESSILSHGIPYPMNVVTMLAVEEAVRTSGATPATIAVISGRIKIGLTHQEIEWLGSTKDALKMGRAEIPYVLAAACHGATTVASTMICAKLADIDVFATGGIGGVHRGVADTMDISSDLDELARTSTTVVCSGAKAILDIPKTLEYLETRGVPVVGFRTDQFPAFWSRHSGERVPIRIDTVEQLAKFVLAKEALSIVGGVLVANPLAEEDEIPLGELESAIDAALDRAGQKGIAGKAVTPFLLKQMSELMGGRTDKAAEALLQSNARLGAQLSHALIAAKQQGWQATTSKVGINRIA
jgi:pseudouridine-5'-phosphate glycosidase